MVFASHWCINDTHALATAKARILGKIWVVIRLVSGDAVCFAYFKEKEF